MKNVKTGTIIRMALMLIAFVILAVLMAPVAFGKPLAELSAEDITKICGVLFVIVTYLINHWKNNSYTPAAIAADEYLESLRDDEDRGGADAEKTTAGLVAWCKSHLGCPYWYGTFGQLATKALYAAKKAQYPKFYTWILTAKELGKQVFDCVGLIKGYLFWNGKKLIYKKKWDVSANGMYEYCKKKGAIGTMPKTPGVLVFKDGHVGVYIGGGKVIEAKGHAYGVIESKLAGGGWTKWGFHPDIAVNTTQENSTAAKPSTGTTQSSSSAKYFKKYTGKSVSIVDALESIGAKYSYEYRKTVAKANGITGYTGTPTQNTKMLNLLKQGKLIKP